MKRLIASLWVITLLIYLVACNSSISSVTPTPKILSTYTTIPTATKTSTPFPTNTPLPSPTPACPPQLDSQATLSSVQEKTAALVSDAKVIWYDSFKCSDLSYGWWIGKDNPTTKVNVSNGLVTFSAQKVKHVWDGFGRISNSLGDQKGFLVLFRYQANTTANLFFSTGTWQISDYRRLGLGIGEWSIANGYGQGYWEGWHGVNWFPAYFPRNVLQPNKWYYLLEKLGNNGEVTMKIWEKDSPANYVDFKKVMPSNWIGHQWLFMVQVYDGTLEMDEYQELSFNNP